MTMSVWRRIKKLVEVQCARAAHVHVFCTFSLFCRPYRPNGAHRRSQNCRSHVHYPRMCAFEVTVHVGGMLRAPGADNFIEMGSSSSGKIVSQQRQTWQMGASQDGIPCTERINGLGYILRVQCTCTIAEEGKGAKMTDRTLWTCDFGPPPTTESWRTSSV